MERTQLASRDQKVRMEKQLFREAKPEGKVMRSVLGQ
jgi:hypothetical protein